MHMSAGTLDHYNVSTRKFQGTVQFYQDVLGFVNGPRARRLISPALGCTVRAIRCCTSTTSPSRISSSAKTQASSIISLCEPRLRIDEAAPHRVPFRVNKVPNSMPLRTSNNFPLMEQQNIQE